MYLIGRIFAQLEAAGTFPPLEQPRQYELVSTQPAAHLSRLITELTRRGKADTIAEMMALLPAEDLADTVPEVEQGDFALGYYHQKAYNHSGDALALEERMRRILAIARGAGRPRVY